METKLIVVEYLKRKLIVNRIAIPETCLDSNKDTDRKANLELFEVVNALWTLCNEFRSQFSDSFELMIGELKVSKDINTAKADFNTVAAELFSEGVKWSHIIALFVFSGELAVAYGKRSWIDLIDPLSDWVTSFVESTLRHWMMDHGDWMGIIDYKIGRADIKDNPWPRLKNLVCGLAAGALGIFTLRALLSQN